MLFRAGRSKRLVLLSAWVTGWSLSSSVPVPGAGQAKRGCRSFLRRGVRHEAVRRERSVGINQRGDLAGFGGHDLHDPQPAESGCSRRAGWAVQSTDVVIAQPVEDELELSSGRGHRADVAVAAAMCDLF